MPKNIIICCDGTGNQFGNNNSNVVKLYSVIEKNLDKQIAYYDPGVGTFKSPSIGISIKGTWKKMIGLATGLGIYQNVYEAYSYLMENYEEGDPVFLFGFSRGAYTVRVLSGFIRLMGLLEKGCQNLIPYAFQIYSNKKSQFDLAKEFKNQFSRNCSITFMGVWDTVSSIGYFGNWKSYPYTANNGNVKTVRHALAIDERRAFYTQNKLGSKRGEQSIKEVWFAGVHSDIGGSYPEKESELSKIPLQWMLNEAVKENLLVNAEKYCNVVLGGGENSVAPNPEGKIHHSLKGPWLIGEIIPKTRVDYSQNLKEWFVPLGRYRTIPEESFIHETVFQRMEKVNDYRPPNIPKAYNTEPISEQIG